MIQFDRFELCAGFECCYSTSLSFASNRSCLSPTVSILSQGLHSNVESKSIKSGISKLGLIVKSCVSLIQGVHLRLKGVLL